MSNRVSKFAYEYANTMKQQGRITDDQFDAVIHAFRAGFRIAKRVPINTTLKNKPSKMLVDKMKILRRLPPYDDSSNTSINDCYFGAALMREIALEGCTWQDVVIEAEK